MLVVEQDVFVIDEAFAGPKAGEAQEIVVEKHKGVAGSHPALARIEPYGDAFVGKVDIAEVFIGQRAASA